MDKNIQRNLRPIWNATLEVYKIFADICARHGLRYCADSGTALGAVRHGGFIPWDDDMDIQMPRPDYEKFVVIAQKELPLGYAWVDRHNCKYYDAAYGKVIVTDETVVDDVAYKSGMKLGQGIFIDVFPLDGYPDSWWGIFWRRCQNNFIRILCAACDSWRSSPTRKTKLFWILGKTISLFLPRRLHIRNARDRVVFYETRAKRIPFGATKLCASVGLSEYYDDKPFPVNCFGTPKQVSFENTTMMVQENVDGYLRSYFGDYMKLPPEDRRMPYHVSGMNVPWRLGPTEPYA